MHLIRPLLTAVLVATVALAASASGAAPGTVKLTDLAGDANGINNQDVPKVSFGGVAGPAQRPEADLLSASFTPTRAAGRCTGFVATLELAAPPGEHLAYRIHAEDPDQKVFWIEYESHALGHESFMRVADGDKAKHVAITPAKVTGNKIILTLTQKDLKAAPGGAPDRFAMYRIGISIRTSVAGEVTAPVWDSIEANEMNSFTPCQ